MAQVKQITTPERTSKSSDRVLIFLTSNILAVLSRTKVTHETIDPKDILLNGNDFIGGVIEMDINTAYSLVDACYKAREERTPVNIYFRNAVVVFS